MKYLKLKSRKCWVWVCKKCDGEQILAGDYVPHFDDKIDARERIDEAVEGEEFYLPECNCWKKEPTAEVKE